MYLTRTSAAAEPNSEQQLRAQIENERRELYDALRTVGVQDPPVELRIEPSSPRADCIFFDYRPGLMQNKYNARYFAEAYVSYSWDGLARVKEEAVHAYQSCNV